MSPYYIKRQGAQELAELMDVGLVFNAINHKWHKDEYENIKQLLDVTDAGMDTLFEKER